MDFSGFINKRRTELGLSHSDIAEKIGYSSQLIFNWEKGKSLPDLSSVGELCKILDISLDEFFMCKIIHHKKDKTIKSFDINNFSNNLKKYRVINNYTQNDLANKLDVSYATIINWEKSKSTPNIIQFIKLCELYKVSYKDLYNGEFNINKGLNKKFYISLLSLMGLVIAGMSAWTIFSLNRGLPPLPIKEGVVATFYDNDKETIIWSKTFNKNDPLIFNGTLIDKSDDQFDYIFLGWDYNEDGIVDDINMNIVTDMDLVACYNPISKVDGVETFEFSLELGTYKITKYNGSDSKVIIPNYYNGTKVTEIGSNAFKDNLNIEEVIISDGISKIGYSAFEGCYLLTKAILPTSMESIGSSAFNKCSLLAELKMPKFLNKLDNSAFSYCSSLVSVDIPTGLTEIGNNAFSRCTKLENVNFPNTLTTFTNSFSNTAIKVFNLPSSIKTIKSFAFSYSESINEVYINDGVTVIENDILYSSYSTKFIVVPNTVKVWSKSKYLGSDSDLKIFYKGTLDELKSISFTGVQVMDFDNLDNLYIYSETPSPQAWHYVEDVPTIYE